MASTLFLSRRAPPGQSARPGWSLLKNNHFLALAMAGAIGVFALFVPPFFLSLFASSIKLTATTGAALTGTGGSTALGRLLSGWLCHRIGLFNSLALTAS